MKILNYLNVSDLTNEIRKNSFPLNIILISTLILPFSLYLGPAIIEILIFLICVSYLCIIIVKKEKIYFNNLIFFFLSFYILLIVSSILSNYILISLKSSLLSIRFAILTFAIIHVSKKINCFLKFFFISSFLCMTLLFLSGLSQFFFNEDYWIISELINNKSSSKSTVVTGFFGEEKKLGSFIARLSPLIIGLYLFISNKEMKKKINSALLYFTPLFLIGFFTSERMAMFYLSLTLFFLLILSIKCNKKNIYKIIIILMLPFILFFSKINQFHLTVENSYKQLFDEGKINYFSKQHKAFAITSIELFKKNPFFGVGPNNYRRECGSIKLKYLENNCSTHPHNIFFQLVSETGGLGFFYYFIINLFFFYKIIKFLFTKKNNELELFLLLPIFYYMNPFFPSGNFFNNWYTTIGIISLPFYIYLTNKKYSAK